MANTVVINVQANTAGATADITTTTVAVDNLTQSTEKLENANQKTGSSFEDVTKNGGAIAILDQLTGGLASRMRDTFEATKLFNFSLKGMRTAIIATGIGALVVAAALLVSYWDDIVGFFSGATSELENQKKEYEEINNKSLLKIKLLKHEREIQKKLGKGVKEINKELEKELLVRQKSVALRLKGLKDIHEKTMQQLAEQVKASHGRGFVSSMYQTLQLKYHEDNKEALEEINTLTADALAIEQDLASLQSIKIEKKKKEIEENKALAELKKTELEELRVAQIDTQKEIREEELNQSDLKYAALLEKARKYYEEDSIQIKELERLQQDATTEINLKHAEEDRAAQEIVDNAEIEKQNRLEEFKNQTLVDKRAEEISALQEQNLALQEEFAADKDALFAIEFAYLEKLAKIKAGHLAEDEEADKIVQETKLQQAKQTFQGIATMLGENSKAGKAAAAAAALINTYQGITAELATKTATPFEIGLKIANVATIAGIGFKAVKKILKTNTKSVSSADDSISLPSGGGAEAPAFNIVGQGQGNQIATALGQQQQTPIQAFVVSQDVTTAQSLENGIIQGATLGG